jgi:hypothetical protein
MLDVAAMNDVATLPKWKQSTLRRDRERFGQSMVQPQVPTSLVSLPAKGPPRPSLPSVRAKAPADVTTLDVADTNNAEGSFLPNDFEVPKAVYPFDKISSNPLFARAVPGFHRSVKSQ